MNVHSMKYWRDKAIAELRLGDIVTFTEESALGPDSQGILLEKLSSADYAFDFRVKGLFGPTVFIRFDYPWTKVGHIEGYGDAAAST
jgi:hypothetical protein